MEKTIKEWFEYLPNDIKRKALNNFDGNEDEILTSLSDAIDGAFNWASTSEGHDYWRSI